MHHTRRNTIWRVLGNLQTWIIYWPFFVHRVQIEHRNIADLRCVTHTLVVSLFKFWEGSINGLIEVEIEGALKLAVFFDDLFVLVDAFLDDYACQIEWRIKLNDFIFLCIFLSLLKFLLLTFNFVLTFLLFLTVLFDVTAGRLDRLHVLFPCFFLDLIEFNIGQALSRVELLRIWYLVSD
jgi:hypothetical protein